MPIIRSEKPFILVEKSLINDKNISFQMKGFLIYLSCLFEKCNMLTFSDIVLRFESDAQFGTVQEFLNVMLENAEKAGYVQRKEDGTILMI